MCPPRKYFHMSRLFIFWLLLSPVWVFPQQAFEVGGFGGFANYQGDLVASHIDVSETKVSYGAFLRYHISRKLKVKANGYFGYISGSDLNADNSLRTRGWSFESNLVEVTGVLEYHPFGKKRYGSTGIFQRQLSPYAFAGVGMVHIDPEVTVSLPEDEALFPEQDFTSPSLAVPLGLGVRVDVLENFSFGLEGGWRATFNDYLDGVSTNGNSEKNDLYIFLGATLSYVFGGEVSELEFN